jgi:hypothetical protein
MFGLPAAPDPYHAAYNCGSGTPRTLNLSSFSILIGMLWQFWFHLDFTSSWMRFFFNYNSSWLELCFDYNSSWLESFEFYEFLLNGILLWLWFLLIGIFWILWIPLEWNSTLTLIPLDRNFALTMIPLDRNLLNSLNSFTLSFWYWSIVPDPDKVKEIVFVLYTVNFDLSINRKIEHLVSFCRLWFFIFIFRPFLFRIFVIRSNNTVWVVSWILGIVYSLLWTWL